MTHAAGLRPKIMVVHDDAAVRDALRFLLQIEGAELCTHEHGAALLADAGLAQAVCLVLKAHLPEMEGIEVLKRVRARGLDIPAILLTNSASPALRARAKAAGVWLVLEKPILDEALVDAVAGLLRGGQVLLRDTT